MRTTKGTYLLLAAWLALSVASYAVAVPFAQDDNTRKPPSNMSAKPDGDKEKQGKAPSQTANKASGNASDKTSSNSSDKAKQDKAKAQAALSALSMLTLSEDSIPDSLLHPRWKIQRTTPITNDDLDRLATDLSLPSNIKQAVEYNDSLDRYYIGSKLGDSYLNTPIVMTPDEYRRWSEKQERDRFFRDKNETAVKEQGEEKFSFSDMHFDLGPAEKIFGKGGVRVKTQGTAEIKVGATMKNIDNPSLPIRNRKTTTMDFDEKINLSVNGKVGEKVNMNLNYNTDATFDFDSQNMKLKYEGKEDEIIKLIEGGNVSFPSNSSLVTGASSLFGIRTDLQFGKLTLQTVVSQKKSSSKSVSSKGGTQLTTFDFSATNYEENRHFWLSTFFRNKYDAWMKTLPNVTTGITINRIEIWVTNKTGTTTNTRNIVALTDLGENTRVSNSQWALLGQAVPCNAANSEYSTIVNSYAAARDIDQTSTTLDAILTGGTDYEKLESARLLTSSEYTLNSAMGYVSLKSTLQTDQVLAVAYEYTYGGVTYQVGEFAADIQDATQALFVKSLKNVSNNPQQGNWKLMMRNVYYLASTVEKEKFKLDVKFQSDTAGVYLSYIPETQVKDKTLIKLLGADRLDANNKANSNGYFDYVSGYTVSNGRVFFPVAEPFGTAMYDALTSNGLNTDVAEQYCYYELYDSTKTVAKQIAEKDKFTLSGQYKGTSANVISLGSYNVPQGSVVVTAGGVTLTEGTDYSVDYSAGEVTILNQSIIDAGTSINVSLESNTDYAQQRKTMVGLNWQYDFSKNFQLSGTLQHLSEQALTTKVSMGAEPLNNTLWGLNANWKKESQWLTNVLNKIPFLHCTQPSQISFTGEFAQLIAGQASGVQDNASYIDDFENTKNTIDVSSPTSWVLSSVPSMFSEQSDKSTLKSGYNRAQMAWYNIDPLFTRRSSSLTPSHIKSDLNQLSNYYVREVYVKELFPNRNDNSYSGATSTLSVLNLAYYPTERGPYNFNPTMNSDGSLPDPQSRWGGMMRKLDTSDFETANIEYIEFWMLDPFIYSNEYTDANLYGGDLYFNLGEVSEDILADGKKFYESGMPIDGTASYTTTQWGKVPTSSTVTYSFTTTSGSRELQDVGYNGLTDEEEQTFSYYQDYINAAKATVTTAKLDSILADPANDNYHYFRGSDYDAAQTSILDRYKKINNPQGNSPDSEGRSESYDTSYKTTPDVEDINQDYTLNEYEKYFQYKVSVRPSDLIVGQNYVVDKRETSMTLRNGETGNATWYQFRIPLDEYEQKVGSISDFSSIRFMRMFLTNFQKPIVLRFGTLDLVRAEWRTYEQSLSSGVESGTLAVSAVNIEENSDKTPVNYVLPPGITRGQDPTQPQLTEDNEQALAFTVTTLASGESKAVYKNTTLDIRQYKTLQMFVHANAFEQNTTDLQDNQLAVFIRLGSDYKSNYYEYEIPLTLTPEGQYSLYSTSDRVKVWPEENMLNISLSLFTSIKKARNKQKALGLASYTSVYTTYDDDNPNNKISIMGNPSLGEIKTMMIGVRNLSGTEKSGEVWVNELRLKEYTQEGGWAAQGTLNIQLSDVGTVNATGKMVTSGFGGLEDGVAARAQDDYKTYSVTTNVELGKFFPAKAKVSAPLYYSVTKENTRPKYNPLDTDILLDDALNDAASKEERDSIEAIAITKTTNTNFSLSNAKVGIATKKHPMPYDPANFTFSYSHSHSSTSGETTVFENEDTWRGAMTYSWTPVYKSLEPFKTIKSKNKNYDILKKFGVNWLPQNVAFDTELKRTYYELQERDLDVTEGSELPLTFSEQFLWNRSFSLRWDFTKNLHMNFSSTTNAEIEEPYTPVNKDLYPDQYQAWKDSVWTSIKDFGRPLTYNQTFAASYQLPLNLMPIFDWVNSDASYNATYNWTRGTELEDGTSYGNTIAMNRTFNWNGTFNLEKFYNHFPFLKKANERFNKASSRKPQSNTNKPQSKIVQNKQSNKSKQFQKEITLRADTINTLKHDRNSKKLLISAKTKDGKAYNIRYKTIDANNIKILNTVDSTLAVKITVEAAPANDEQSWYKTLQCVARGLMLVRSVSFSYRNQYSMSVSGFLPDVGDFTGQHRGDILSPGMGFAFGLAGDNWVEQATERGWLLMTDSVASPATTSLTEDLQLKMTLEPVKNLKIDLNASRTQTTAKSIQYMYSGSPTTQSGTLTITTLSLNSAFEGMGNANNGYKSASFNRFCRSLEGFRNQVEAQYIGSTYPDGTSLAGQTFNTDNGTVSQYNADVMIPAFLAAYTNSSDGLSLFPSLAKMLPNWSLKYSGLTVLPWFKKRFKSVNITHAYKSIYAIGSYSSYSTFVEYMDGLGYITDATTSLPTPSSMYNISTVSINEAFSPLLGVDVTLPNNLTCKLEYKTTRVLSLSMTSIQINESLSKDWVLGFGYKINDFKLFNRTKNRTVKGSNKNKGNGDDDSDNSKSKTQTKSRSKSFNTDLNLRLDLSLRKQASICRDIATMTSAASSGNNAFKLSFSADYALSRMLTMSFYYDRQTNTPLLTSSSYPTTTQDFGVSLKFSLTR